MTTEDVARAVLGGSNVHGVEDVQRHFGYQYTPEQRAALAQVPFSEKLLKACAGTHLLVAGAPLSLLDVRDRHPSLFWAQKPAWYDREAEADWARLAVEPRWHLLRKQPPPDSLRKAYGEQCALLSSDEQVPRANEVVYSTILHSLAAGECLFKGVWVRCAERDSYGCRVIVGGFAAGGLHVSSLWGDEQVGGLGLVSARKFPEP
jgi:hypothetical protein